MSSLDFIVKLGGSAITDKRVFETPNTEVICKVANVLAQCYLAGKRFIVLHGAGSFGHHQCKEYQVNNGYKSCSSSEIAQQRKIGACLTRASVNQLSLILINELVKNGIPALLISNCSTWQTDNGAVVKADCNVIEHALKENFVPVLSGDVVFDVTKGCSILSSDVLLKVLCERMNVQRAIFLMNCPGIFTQPPEKPGSEHLRMIWVEKDGSTSIPLEMNCTVPDVSGGIHSKLELGKQIITSHSGRIPVLFCSADADAFYRIAMFGDLDGVQATRLCFRNSP